MHDAQSLLEQLNQHLANSEEYPIPSELISAINKSHPAHIADMLESIPNKQRANVWTVINDELKGHVITELHEEVQQQIIALTERDVLVKTVTKLDVDDLADIDALLPEDVFFDVIQQMDVDRRHRFELIRDCDDGTAGGLMNPDAIVVRADISLEVVKRYLRLLRQQSSLPEHLDALFVVDEFDHYLGFITLTDIVSLPDNTAVKDIVSHLQALSPSKPAKEVAQLFADQDLVSIAVTDSDGYLLGRITIDDVVDIIRTEAEDNLLNPVGLASSTDLFAPTLQAFQQRSYWLVINILNAFISAYVISHFQTTIAETVILAALMPIVASMGGTCGTQTLGLVTRGLAVKQLSDANTRRLFSSEMTISLMNGALWGIFVFLVTWFWTTRLEISVIFASALTLNLIMGAMLGIIIPLTLDRMGVDPALAGAVILLALTDVLGFSLFLGLASLFI